MRRTICHIEDLDEYVSDTDQVMAHVRQRFGIEIDILLSHSTGGLVAMKMLSANPDTWNSAVMIAPFFGLGGPNWLEFSVRFLSRGLCRLGFARNYLLRRRRCSDAYGQNRLMNPETSLSRESSRSGCVGRLSPPQRKPGSALQLFDPKKFLTSDARRYARNLDYLNDNPELFVDGISLGWLDACFRAQKTLGSEAEGLAVHAVLPPITLVLCGNDRIVANRKTKAMFADNPAVTIIEIPEARHELLQERDHFRAQFWAAFDRHVRRCHAGVMPDSELEKGSDPAAAPDKP